ncbi:hypothetical protein BH10BDE1_BH10BDE1_10020 [soil metagenome]
MGPCTGDGLLRSGEKSMNFFPVCLVETPFLSFAGRVPKMSCRRFLVNSAIKTGPCHTRRSQNVSIFLTIVAASKL